MSTRKKTKKSAPLRVPVGGHKSPPKLPESSPAKDAGEGVNTPKIKAGAAPAVTVPKAPRLPVTVVEASRGTTVDAVYLEAIEHGLTKRDAERMAEGVADRLRIDDDDAPGVAPPGAFFDLRALQDYRYPGGKHKAKMRAPGVPFRRKPETITTIVVHQTAVEYGVSQRAIEAAGGDVELARARRALDVACHALAFRQGYFVAAHDLDVHVNHAGRFNPESLGLEIDGRYSGLEDDPRTMAREDLKTTWGGKPTKLTDATVTTSINAIGWLATTGRAQGMPIAKIVSHRQSSDNRRSDPGQAIWQRIVIPAAAKFDLEIVTASPWKQGRPVPVEWDPERGIGKY